MLPQDSKANACNQYQLILDACAGQLGMSDDAENASCTYGLWRASSLEACLGTIRCAVDAVPDC